MKKVMIFNNYNLEEPLGQVQLKDAFIKALLNGVRFEIGITAIKENKENDDLDLLSISFITLSTEKEIK